MAGAKPAHGRTVPGTCQALRLDVPKGDRREVGGREGGYAAGHHVPLGGEVEHLPGASAGSPGPGLSIASATQRTLAGRVATAGDLDIRRDGRTPTLGQDGLLARG